MIWFKKNNQEKGKRADLDKFRQKKTYKHNSCVNSPQAHVPAQTRVKCECWIWRLEPIEGEKLKEPATMNPHWYLQEGAWMSSPSWRYTQHEQQKKTKYKQWANEPEPEKCISPERERRICFSSFQGNDRSIKLESTAKCKTHGKVHRTQTKGTNIGKVK